MLWSSSLLPAPGMPAIRPRSPSVRAGSIENVPSPVRPIGAASPSAGARQASAIAAGEASPMPSSSSSGTCAGTLSRPRAAASRTGASARATSSAQSRWTPSAVTPASVVPAATSVTRMRATSSSASAIVVTSPGRSSTARPSHSTAVPAR